MTTCCLRFPCGHHICPGTGWSPTCSDVGNFRHPSSQAHLRMQLIYIYINNGDYSLIQGHVVLVNNPCFWFLNNVPTRHSRSKKVAVRGVVQFLLSSAFSTIMNKEDRDRRLAFGFARIICNIAVVYPSSCVSCQNVYHRTRLT